MYLKKHFSFIVFIFYIKNYQSEISEESEEKNDFHKSIYIKLLITFVGIFIGGKLFLDGSLNLSSYFGLSETIIGISILAIGPMLFLDLIIKILGIDIGGLGILSFLMPVLFIYIGIQANAEYIEGNKPKLS